MKVFRKNLDYVNIHIVNKTKGLDGGKEELIQVPANTEVTFLGKKEYRYCLVQLENGLTGWVLEKYLID